jgi:hypothetical protein
LLNFKLKLGWKRMPGQVPLSERRRKNVQLTLDHTREQNGVAWSEAFMKRGSQPSRTGVIGLLALAWLTSVAFAQASDKTPAKANASIQTAMDEARDALKRYQTALASVRDLPEVGPTVREDLQVVLASRNTIDWLRGKADLERAVVPSEFVGLLESIEGCAVNAALSASALAAGAARTGGERELQATMDFVSASAQLRSAANNLRRALKPYLQTEKPSRIARAYSNACFHAERS